MKVLFHLPNPDTVYAGRTIAYGYKHACEALGHTFTFLTPNDDQKVKLLDFQPDIFVTSLGPLPLKFLNLNVLKKAKQAGTKVFVNLPFWRSPFAAHRINETPSLKDNQEYIRLLLSAEYGDVYFNACEAGDPRMEGIEKVIGQSPRTLLLAADKTMIYPEYDERFTADISYIGTYLPDKRPFFKEVVFPLQQKYQIKLYGQDWTWWDRQLGLLQRVGQYFNLPVIKSLRAPSLKLEDERKIYTSSTISLNVHEPYQRQYGDLNERTFKIPLAGGFEIVDNVPSLSKYFRIGQELVVANSPRDWLEKFEYYLQHPEKRSAIIEAGRKKVLAHHTYHHRVKTLIKWWQTIKG